MVLSDILAGSFGPVLAYFVLVLCIDIAFGVARSLIASFKASRGHIVAGTFSWDYLASFAKTQLLSPPVLAVAGAAYLSAQSGANGSAILAVATTAALAQSLILTRDVFNKIRSVVALLAAPATPAAGAPAAK